ncbi:MAG: TetR family transcriptional regulator C-terminal domain-containing protein [Candidatus Nitricoxidivorans perseverans]|uniref:TetR family transcriptional regulator C-terminal domain-containing protein n=1 Tax=Candidatus Nitricoxidivorans perseverans TaxID=2975601 RepID=A0AA49FMR1_9PROT|nr:MAG: TetR family transcriptional regulator C-terminal domain-containing protein [Candidatus Nitricoxidivorans perseverans]
MSTKQTDLTREKLLDAAFCEIHRHGFQAASIAKILQDTGLTKGALYHHFPTKQELGLAVVDEVIRARLDELVFRRLRDSARPLDTLIEIIGELGARNDAETVALGCPLNNLMQEMSPLDATFKERLNAILTHWGTIVEDALHRARAAGALRPGVDCRAASLFIVSAWEGCTGIAKSLQSAAGFVLCMRQLQDYVRSLMAAPPA